MAALGVHEYQRLVGREAAQRRRADGVGAVGETRPGEVEGGQRDRQRLAQFRHADVLERRRGHDVDRYRGLGDGAVRHTRTGDHDVLEPLEIVRGDRWRHGLCERSGDCAGQRSHPCATPSMTHRHPLGLLHSAALRAAGIRQYVPGSVKAGAPPAIERYAHHGA